MLTGSMSGSGMRSEAVQEAPERFDPEALEHLAALPWRGNVRELRNLVERLLILSAGRTVDRHDVVAITGVGLVDNQIPQYLVDIPETIEHSPPRPERASCPRTDDEPTGRRRRGPGLPGERLR